MEEDIEDLVGEVTYIDSQNSIPVEVNAIESQDNIPIYSCDFEDTSSERQYSSCKETYVIDVDESEDTDSLFAVENSTSSSTTHDKLGCTSANTSNTQSRKTEVARYTQNNVTRFACKHPYNYSKALHESFTQTSKTIIEIARTEGLIKTTKTKTLETQTSMLCISENKNLSSLETRGEFSRSEVVNKSNTVTFNNFCHVLNTSLEDGSSKFPVSETEIENSIEGSDISSEYMTFLNEESKEDLVYEDKRTEQNRKSSDFLEITKSDSEFEEDSLLINDQDQKSEHPNASDSDSIEIPGSVDNDVEELYHKLTKNINVIAPDRSSELDIRRISTLTPLSEETTTKKGSIIDITPRQFTNNPPSNDSDKDVLFTNSFGFKVKILPDEDKPTPTTENLEPFKLPLIQRNASFPNSPLLKLLFTVNTASQPLNKAETSPCIYKGEPRKICRWGIDKSEVASGSGENPRKSEPINDTDKLKHLSYLPPIHIEGQIKTLDKLFSPKSPHVPKSETSEKSSISISKKINELKKVSNKCRSIWSKAHSPVRSPEGGACSPDSMKSSGSCEATEKGCDALCQDLLKRLRSTSWFDVTEALNDLPKVLNKFWSNVSEQKIADLIRQITSHVESPRSQVAKTACGTLSEILKNTNYTKKPDFYEAVSILLTKTGSYSMPVRRAANVALDQIVCTVDVSHAVTALCVHGAGHKSPLVRCAAARLLVVSAALSNGGRDLLKSRPTAAATARRQVLQALSVLIEDKNNDTRKYAERLYSMLRPLANFEAYYLTDVQVELASTQMKKYDLMLRNQMGEKYS